MKLFVDSSAWYALLDSSDSNHKLAVKKQREIESRKISLVTSYYVFDETVTLIRMRFNHSKACLFGNNLLASKLAKVLNIKDDVAMQAWEIFLKYKDHDFSFTDCSSFVLMRENGIKAAFTFDDHFRQFGLAVF